MFKKIFQKKNIIQKNKVEELVMVAPDTFTLSNHTFSLNFYKHLDTDNQNIFFSSLGICLAFSLLYQGSEEKTKDELEQIFGFEMDSIIRYLNFISMVMGSELSNQNELDIISLFVSFVESGFSAELQEIAQRSEQLQLMAESGGDPVGTSQKIEQLISKCSRGKYRSMLPLSDRQDPDALYFITVIYFAGKWLDPFEEKATYQRFFLPSSGLSDLVAMMHMTENYKYYEETDLQILELPYTGSNLSMLILLPSQQQGISWLEQLINTELITNWIRGLENRMVKVYLPKFSMENSLSLIEPLKSLGMSDTFDPEKADFRKLTREAQQVYIAGVLQRSWIEVNESGTKAVAVTGLDLPAFMREEKPKEPAVFMADHPFLFFIIQRTTKMILFMGKVEKP